jgi:predicted DCC family thiol-disulfide oxidoreductase YuxK
MARTTVIYDSDCGFCKFSLALLLSWDRPRTGRGRRGPGTRALRPLPLGTAEADRQPHLTERGYRWVVDHRGFLGRFVPARARRWADRVIAAH